MLVKQKIGCLKVNENNNRKTMKITNLPFYYNSHNKGDNGGQPHILPFNLKFDDELKMFRQESTPELNKILLNVYDNGSLVDGSISSLSGVHYVDKIIDFIKDHFPLESESRILEIGYGSGILLKEFLRLGYKNIYGIEPGHHELVSGLEDVLLIQDFYPSKSFVERVDLIIHILVLEHVENPLEFIKVQAKQLEKNGKIIFFVPNEEPFLNNGDCSSFIHEHFNYFTRESVSKLVKNANLFLEDISIIDGLLAITLTDTRKNNLKEMVFPQFKYDLYFVKLEKNIENIKKILLSYEEKEIALYVPGRALNIMCLLDIKEPRLVDDNSEIHGKYLPFFKNKVESFSTLVDNPPKVIFIWSLTFGSIIKNKCLESDRLSNTKILTLYDLLNV